MKWQRIDHRNLRNIGGTLSDRIKRVYGLDGKIWPRMTISIGPDPFEPGFTISADRKDDVDSWWGKCPIPYELANEIPELVKEFMESRK